MTKMKKSIIAFAVCIVVAVVSMFAANNIQTNGGKVNVVTAAFEATKSDGETYNVTYKIYIPEGVDEAHPAPALLCLHGYQNDKETSAAFAMEAARRGMVALAIDEFGHGSNSASMINRGSTTYKIQGQSKDGKETTIKTQLKGAQRYLTLMNFSTLSFFEGDVYAENEQKYVHIDADKDGLKDSSMGGIAAFNWLKSQKFVQADKIGITGHSMGTWATWSTAAACQDHAAIALQCGEVFGSNIFDEKNIKFNNLLMLQARYDEFNYFRDYRQETVNDSMLDSGIRDEFFTAYGQTELKDNYTWNTTYGDFANGTARRVELLETNHRLTTHDANAISTTMEWMTTALGVKTDVKSTDLVYMTKELLVLLAMLAVMISLCPMVVFIGSIKPFRTVIFDRTASAREPKLMSRGRWWKNALIAVLISAVTYPFCTQLGHGLFPLPEGLFRMTIGNGFLIWYLILAIISIVMVSISRAIDKKKGKELLDYYDMGLSRESKASKLDWELLGKSFVVAALAICYMYIVVLIFQRAFQLDLRFIWPFFKEFSVERFGQFLVYLPFFALFFVVNVGFKLFGNMRQIRNDEKPVSNFIKCWMGNVFVLLGGLLVVMLLEYIPFFMGAGPGADLLFGTTFGGPFMSALILLAPQFVFFTFLSTWFERKTGNVYVGAFISAMIASWVVTGGSAML